jgi:hypothetical protein
MEMNIRDFLYFIKTLDCQSFKTLHRKLEFDVHVLTSGMCYTPVSTGKSRSQTWKFVERVAMRFSEIGSFHPGDYVGISVNASYLLTLIDYYLNHKKIDGL